MARSRLERKAESFAAAAGAFCVLVGCVVLVGWIFDIVPLQRLHPDWVTMRPNTALGFIGAGSALWLTVVGKGTARQRISWIAALLVSVLGALTFAEYLSGRDFGIDDWLGLTNIAPTADAPHPARMSIVTALHFALLGMALALLPFMIAERYPWLVDAPVLLAAFSSCVAILGYFYDPQSLYAIVPYDSVAFHTAWTFFALCAGVILARPGRGLARLLVGEHAGGAVARRLLPFAIAVPVALGWVRLEAQRSLHLFDVSVGVMFLVSTNIVIFVVIILWNVRALDRADRERQRLDLIGRLNAELNQRLSELAAANKELEAFSYSVSHDLRAPLRAIDGFSRLVLEEHAERLPEDGKNFLQIVRRNTQQMGHLIDDLLAFSRLSRQAMKIKSFSLTKMAKETLGDLKPDYDGRTIDIVVGDLGRAMADPALMKQVFANLLGNAIKFTRHKGDSRIEIGRRESSPENQDEKIYYVKDNGAGFDMRYVDKLFGVFQRLHRAEDYEGTGVGLAIVQRIIHRHGGRIWAEGEVNEGATFYFTLGRTEHDRAVPGNSPG